MVLRVGLILVILSGLAIALFSAGVLLLGISLSGDGRALADLWPLVITLVLALVGMWGTAKRRLWGPLLVAASSGAWVAIAALNIAGSAPAAFAVSAVLAIIVAIGLWRTPSAEGPQSRT